MARDYEVRRKLWDAKVPVQFVLDSCEALQCSAKPYFVSHYCYYLFFSFIFSTADRSFSDISDF